jgi:predicted small lipoprotein YifL
MSKQNLLNRLPFHNTSTASQHRRWGASVAALALALASAGCGRNEGPLRIPVEGAISIDSQPLQSGVIRFIPTGGTEGPAAAAMIEDGVYALSRDDGPVVGTHRVEIEATFELGFELDDEQASARWASQGHSIPRNPIPARYNTHSALTAEVTSDGPNQFDFTIDTNGSAQQQ